MSWPEFSQKNLTSPKNSNMLVDMSLGSNKCLGQGTYIDELINEDHIFIASRSIKLTLLFEWVQLVYV